MVGSALAACQTLLAGRAVQVHLPADLPLLELVTHPVAVDPDPKNGEIHVLQVRGNVYMLVGDGGNVVVQTGDDGAFVVDTGGAAMMVVRA